MIEIKNLDFSYKSTKVFSNISLHFEEGKIYGLLGENGVGKTTLLKLISGLQKPLSGTCMVDQFTSFEREPAFLQNVVFLPDDFNVPDTTPEKYFNRIGVFYPSFSIETFHRLMKEMEVDPSRKFNELSCGQQKKALVAGSLSLHTRYILLDEPTNGLDIPSKADFRRVLSELCNDETTIVISTHQVKDVENLIDRIIILSNDDVLLDASFDQITQKLFFQYGGEKNPESLYSEMIPSGYLNVLRNAGTEESQVNIEALFNAVLHNKNVIKEMFNK